MGKIFKFAFERGGVLIADALEKEAPECVRIFEEMSPRTFKVYHCMQACHELTSDDIPIHEPVPEENLIHFGKLGDVATVSGNQSDELTGLEKAGYSTICWAYHLPQEFMGAPFQTNRASVFARVRENFTLLREIGHRIHIHGEESCTMTCEEEE